jgi:hypothetical protein
MRQLGELVDRGSLPLMRKSKQRGYEEESGDRAAQFVEQSKAVFRAIKYKTETLDRNEWHGDTRINGLNKREW